MITFIIIIAGRFVPAAVNIGSVVVFELFPLIAK